MEVLLPRINEHSSLNANLQLTSFVANPPGPSWIGKIPWEGDELEATIEAWQHAYLSLFLAQPERLLPRVVPFFSATDSHAYFPKQLGDAVPARRATNTVPPQGYVVLFMHNWAWYVP